MLLSRYEYVVSKDFLTYEFCSEGPKGKIRKIISFTRVRLYPYSYYNLGFGDLTDPGLIDDFVTSNNQDAEKILATVAHAVLSFTSCFKDAWVFAEGSTPSRTRRYQMGINKYWNDIDELFEVYGLIENEGFEVFRPGRNYKAFAVKRKNRNFK